MGHAGGGGMVQAAEDGWNFSVTPYLWAIGADGDVGVGAVSAPVDVGFLDAAQDLEFGGMLSAEAQREPWSVLGDVAYIGLEDDVSTAVGKLEVEFEQWILQGAVTHLVLDTGKTRLDAGLGGRYVSLDTDIATPMHAHDVNASDGWADPIVVARVRQQFAAKCFGVLYGDIGGFGVSSDLTWQLMAAVGHSFNETVSMLIGYRYLDYEQDAFSFDVTESGLAFGLQFRL